jgi:hypothetical protein
MEKKGIRKLREKLICVTLMDCLIQLRPKDYLIISIKLIVERYNRTPEEIRQAVEAELSKPEYKDMFAVPISSTHILIGGAVVNAKEFGKAMREAHVQYWKDKH